MLPTLPVSYFVRYRKCRARTSCLHLGPFVCTQRVRVGRVPSRRPLCSFAYKDIRSALGHSAARRPLRRGLTRPKRTSVNTSGQPNRTIAFEECGKRGHVHVHAHVHVTYGVCACRAFATITHSAKTSLPFAKKPRASPDREGPDDPRSGRLCVDQNPDRHVASTRPDPGRPPCLLGQETMHRSPHRR